MKVVNVACKSIITIQIPHDELMLLTLAYSESSPTKRRKAYEDKYGTMPTELSWLNNSNDIYDSLQSYLKL